MPNLKQAALYSLPVIPVYFLVGPLAVINGIYAKNFGISLVEISYVLLICRLFDAISDPVVGFLSDRNYARSGSRKSYVIAGALSLVLAGFFLLIPVGSIVGKEYLLICALPISPLPFCPLPCTQHFCAIPTGPRLR